VLTALIVALFAGPTQAGGDLTAGDPCHPPGQVRCGDPINTYNGDVFFEVTDYETAGPNKLAFKTYYNPATGNDGVFSFTE
jgi:hypothetical protein